MTKGRVLVIDDDEWVCRLLAVAMKEAGFEITISESAADGFFRAVEEQPDCIVCDVDLPDHNGYWVAKKIRSHPSRVSTIPLVFLSGLDDREHRLEGFQVGGDAYLTKPFRIDEVVAQVEAFIQMAARLRKQRSTLASIPPPGAAMTGDLAQMGVATILTLLDLERRSGRLELKSAQRRAALSILSGNVVATTLDDVPNGPRLTIRTTRGWSVGKFSFTPTNEKVAPEIELTPINALLMEAARLEDEAKNSDEPTRSSQRIAEVLEAAARAPSFASSMPPTGVPDFSSVAPSSAPDSLPILEEIPQAPRNVAPPPPPPKAPLRAAPSPGAKLPAPTNIPGGRANAGPTATRSTTPRQGTPSPALGANPTDAKPAPPTTDAKPTPPTKELTPLPSVQPGGTAFGAALRSLSPSRPIRAVTAPPRVDPSTTPAATPASPPAQEAPAKQPDSAGTPETPQPESLDTGWSVPPPDEPKGSGGG
jgi:DNA-binding response OmpR family regulator